jgi:probable F420-dependent oxidoreductase
VSEANVRPFRFGVSASQAESGADLAAKARRAEELGYDTYLVADHLLDLLSPFAALGFAAEATSRIKLGTLVLNNDFRHPALVAREAATLQLLSGGRFELGIGAGHAGVENASVGLPFDSADRRIERLEESLEIIAALRSGDPVTYPGRYYTLREHSLFPPLATPMPLLVGGNGRRVLQVAARHADIIGFAGFFPTVGGASKLTHFTEAGLANRIDIVRNAATERFADIELNCLVQGVVVTDEPAPVFERLSGSTGLPRETFASNPFYLVGSVDDICAQLQRRRTDLGISYYAVFEKDMEALAPVVARMGGT